jgi:hypothetical protein
VGQWDKGLKPRTRVGTSLRQDSLKALVGKALSRDSAWDKNGTGGNQSCPTEEGSGTRKPDRVPVMSKTSAPLVSHNEIAERIAIMVHDGAIPEQWAMGFAQLQSIARPASIPAARWLQVIDDSGRFGATVIGIIGATKPPSSKQSVLFSH